MFAAFGSNDGTQPFSTLVLDSQGNLFGTTNQGGGGAGGTFCLNGCGAIFKLAPNGDGTYSESVIHSFPGTKGNSDGENPRGGLVFDGAGNLWGTTQTGGNFEACVAFQDFTGCGTVFKLSPQADEGALITTDQKSAADDPLADDLTIRKGLLASYDGVSLRKDLIPGAYSHAAVP